MASERKRRRTARKVVQLALEYPIPKTWGGARAGAGRKKSARPPVPHRCRPGFRKGTPTHVTLRVLPEAAGLRRRHLYQHVRRSFLRCGHRDAFRICHYSIQGNHLHLIVEAADRGALSRGIQGFSSSVARRLNAARGRRGQVFADRYHHRALTTPTEVRNALCYVLNNWRRHRIDREHPDWRTDPFSSADLFDGWAAQTAQTRTHRSQRPVWLDPDEPIPIAAPRFWLLTTSWRQLAPISQREVPGPRPS